MKIEVLLPPADKASGTAIVLCPGAGRIRHVTDREGYPVITMGKFTHKGSRDELLGPDPEPELVRLYSNETQVVADTPPTFLAHAVDDTPVPPENSRQFVAAMRAHRVSVVLLELPSGGHGLNGCQGPLWEQWKSAAIKWLAGQQFVAAVDHE